MVETHKTHNLVDRPSWVVFDKITNLYLIARDKNGKMGWTRHQRIAQRFDQKQAEAWVKSLTEISRRPNFVAFRVAEIV